MDAASSAVHSAEFARRLSQDAWSLNDRAAARQNTINLSCLSQENAALREATLPPPGKPFVPVCAFVRAVGKDKKQKGPHRLTLLPLDATVFENASPEDARWLAEQEARFASDAEGLATKPNFGLISFEAVNFMDGRRSTSEIADLLSAEYLLDIDQGWVDRLVSILEKEKVVGK